MLLLAKTTANAVATAIIHNGVSTGTIIGIKMPETRKPSWISSFFTWATANSIPKPTTLQTMILEQYSQKTKNKKVMRNPGSAPVAGYADNRHCTCKKQSGQQSNDDHTVILRFDQYNHECVRLIWKLCSGTNRNVSETFKNRTEHRQLSAFYQS